MAPIAKVRSVDLVANEPELPSGQKVKWLIMVDPYDGAAWGVANSRRMLVAD